MELNVCYVKEYLKLHNMAKTKFCKLVDISLRDLDKLYKNDLTISLRSLQKVAVYINKPLAWMFQGARIL